MTSYNKKDCESIKYLAPLYVKGTLSDTEKAEFEETIVECQELKDEVERWKAISDAYKSVEEKIPQPSGMLYSRITERIRETKGVSLLERFMPSPRFSIALIAAQLLIIITLAAYVINLKTGYKTLTAPSITAEAPIKINVIFKENASETEIRKLLLQIDAKIIDGPHSSGLYVIGIAYEERLADALNIFKKSRIVVMAERA